MHTIQNEASYAYGQALGAPTAAENRALRNAFRDSWGEPISDYATEHQFNQDGKGFGIDYSGMNLSDKYQGRVGDDDMGPIVNTGGINDVPGGLDFDGDGIPDLSNDGSPVPDISPAWGSFGDPLGLDFSGDPYGDYFGDPQALANSMRSLAKSETAYGDQAAYDTAVKASMNPVATFARETFGMPEPKAAPSFDALDAQAIADAATPMKAFTRGLPAASTPSDMAASKASKAASKAIAAALAGNAPTLSSSPDQSMAEALGVGSFAPAPATEGTPAFERSFSPAWGGEDGGDLAKAAMRSAAASDPAGTLSGLPGMFSGLGKGMSSMFGGASPTFGGTPLGPVSAADSYGFGMPGMTADLGPVSTADSFGFSPGDTYSADGLAAMGSFGGIGTPTADQAAAQQDMLGLSIAGLSGTPANSIVGPTQKADVYAPGLRDFKNAFEASVKPGSIGPKYSKAIAAALSTPSIDNQVAAVNATKAYSRMNGIPNNPEVVGLRNQQIGDFAMANPALGNALGLSMGQGGQGAISGGLGGDPFGGRSFGGPSGPGAGSGGGYGGGGPGQPSGPSFGGPTGPGAGPMGRGPSGNPGAGGGLTGPSGPGAGPSGGYGGGNPAGSPSPGGVTTGRGPSSNPGSGGGLSSSAAAAIGRALAHEAAAAAASSDAARGFGGYRSDPMGRFGGIF